MDRDYQRTQVGRITLTAGGASMAAVALWSLCIASAAPLAILVVPALLVALFSTLTVTVSGAGVDVAFGPGLIRRRIPLARIRSVRAVRNAWYYGWGIRMTPHGWLWSVSGLGGVELEFTDGRRFRIGSDEPESLAAAVDGALGR